MSCKYGPNFIICGVREGIGSEARPDMIVAVGFGSATVQATRSDGVVVHLDGEQPRGRGVKHALDRKGWLTLRSLEKWIRRERRHGRRYTRVEVSIFGPLSGASWERRNERGQARYICTESNEGFA